MNWTKEETKQLVEIAKRCSNQEHASQKGGREIVGRTYNSCMYKIRKMGLFGDRRYHKKVDVQEQVEPVERVPVVEVLERRVIELQDENRQLKAKVKAGHRESGVIEAITEEAVKLIHPMEPPPSFGRSIKKDPIQESLVMHVTDEHVGKIVTPGEVGGIEDYNIDVALARAERLVETTIRHTINNMAGYDFDELVMLMHGDHVDGEIHGLEKRSDWGNVMKSTIAAAQMHVWMVRDLVVRYPKVKMIYLSGNHARRTVRKDHHGAQESWDWVVAQMVKEALKNDKRVEVVAPNSFDHTLDIKGHRFSVQHGDDIKMWNGIPHYGIERSQRRHVALSARHDDKVIEYFCLGHFHSHSSLTHTTGESFINGEWFWCDQFSYNAFKGANRPMQLIHGVHKTTGVSWRMPVYLNFKDDVNGPKRYKVSF